MVALAIVGAGKIARDQHVPAIAANPAFQLVASASPSGGLDGVPAFESLPALLASGIKVEAVSICTPPGVRHDIAVQAIDAGLHAFLEKPPAASLSQVADLTARAAAKGVTLFASWHSREAAGVAPARDWLKNKKVTAARITWREDIRRWHPGQEWILGAGGFGCFDPGINALSILTGIMPEAVTLIGADMDVPEGRVSPLKARLTLQAGSAPVAAEFDFLQTGDQTWQIEVDTDAGALLLDQGGDVLSIAGQKVETASAGEYPGLYRRFADLIAARQSDVDARPLQLVADAFLLGERHPLPPFSF